MFVSCLFIAACDKYEDKCEDQHICLYNTLYSVDLINTKKNEVYRFWGCETIHVSQEVSSFWRTLLYPYSGWLRDGGIIKVTRGK
jgi:hypothetical protein